MGEKQVYRSNGKLLITGEYLVLRGADALAVPLLMGQTLEIKTTDTTSSPVLCWRAYAPGRLWFDVDFDLPHLNVLHTSDPQKAAKLQIILLTLQQMKLGLFNGNISLQVSTQLDFEPEWGFGSSSTLIANLAQWAGVNPFTLLNLSIGGSGYDIACANAGAPIFYKLHNLRPDVRKAHFNPAFADKLHFVYRGRKQQSANSVIDFNARHGNADLKQVVEAVSNITAEAASTASFERFCALMNQHEEMVSALLLEPAVKTQYAGFDGQLKSLGAWGGDFMLAMSPADPAYVREYFEQQGLKILFSYTQLVKQ